MNNSQPIKKNNQKQLIINKKDFTAAVASPHVSKMTENKEQTIVKDEKVAILPQSHTDVVVVGETFKASQVMRVRQIQNSQKTLEIIK